MIVPIVEGDGEFEAVPRLIRKVLWAAEVYDVQIARAKNAHGVGNLRAQGGERDYLERFLRYARIEPGATSVLVLVDADADRDCPPRLARFFAGRARTLNMSLPVAVVVASPGYEAWLIASADTMAGRPLSGPGGATRPGLAADTAPPDNPEAVGNPKRWLSERMPPGRVYKETLDQPALTGLLDVALARERSKSFRHFEKGVLFLVNQWRRKETGVSPATELQ